jgi:decaprenyl-phosphate phosphoribosyltransferase
MSTYDAPRLQSLKVPPRNKESVAGRARTLLRAMRPRQWTKNVLVFAAPAASGAISHPGPLGRTFGAFGIFVAASSCTYLVNDVIDRESDRRHPVKRDRPVASGALAPASAVTVASVLGLAAVGAAFVIGVSLAAIVIAYLMISLAYSFGLKRVPVVELLCVGSGFTLRAVAGGAAAHVLISPWFLVMTSFGALLIVAGKRSSEQSALGEGQRSHRKVLGTYPVAFLRGVQALAVLVTIATYCLWVFERAAGLRPADRSEDLILFELSIIPFVLAVLALQFAFSKGRGGQPEELALSDRVLQLLGVAWVALLLCGIYA